MPGLIYSCLCKCVYTRAYINVCLCAYVYACLCVCLCVCLSERVYMFLHPCEHVLLNCVHLSSTVSIRWVGGWRSGKGRGGWRSGKGWQGRLIVCFCGRLATVQGNNPASFVVFFFEIVFAMDRWSLFT